MKQKLLKSFSPVALLTTTTLTWSRMAVSDAPSRSRPPSTVTHSQHATTITTLLENILTRNDYAHWGINE
jgi:hypothetical protein